MDDGLPLTVLRLRFRARTRPQLGGFPGAVWRGALGAQLREQVCATRLERCSDCPVARQCPYPVLFETVVPEAPASALLNHNGRTTPPFVLVPDLAEQSRAKDEVTVGLNLVGQTPRNAALLVRALAIAAQRGLGRTRSSLEWCAVEQADLARTRGPGEHAWRSLEREALSESLAPVAIPPVPAAPTAVDIQFLSPLRMRIRGRYVGPREFEPLSFVRGVLRRATHLGASHCPAFDDTRLAALARDIRALHLVASDLRWEDRRRYSARQGRNVPMGGLVGRVRVTGAALPAVWPWLWQAQWWHAGKGATMGLGRYHLIPAGGA